jgi:transcription-repair coupling factor (superfamily II helicase)
VEGHVADLGVRLGLYRRIAALADRREIDGFAAELIDHFGALPPEVVNLREIVAIKRYCRDLWSSASKDAVIAVRGNPEGLVELIQRHAGTLKLRPDQKIVYLRNWEDEKTRLAGVASYCSRWSRSPAPPYPKPT